MKYCPRCEKTLPKESFGKNKRRSDGLAQACKPCRARDGLAKYHENKEMYNDRRIAKYHSDIDKSRAESRAKYYKYHDTNKVRNAESSSKYRAKRLQATLRGIDEDLSPFYQKAKDLTNLTGIRHEVDHIVPLRGERVCGLHVSWNLQVLSITDNRSKRNKWNDDMETNYGTIQLGQSLKKTSNGC
jgi:5-methylcytosine-specific restriction endonuclease McrA